MTTWDAHNDAVLAVLRKQGDRVIVGLFNFSGVAQSARLDGSEGVMSAFDAELAPYEARVIVR